MGSMLDKIPISRPHIIRSHMLMPQEAQTWFLALVYNRKCMWLMRSVGRDGLEAGKMKRTYSIDHSRCVV